MRRSSMLRTRSRMPVLPPAVTADPSQKESRSRNLILGQHQKCSSASETLILDESYEDRVAITARVRSWCPRSMHSNAASERSDEN